METIRMIELVTRMETLTDEERQELDVLLVLVRSTNILMKEGRLILC